ncbi:MAG TPA: hypothetical protein VN654_15085 [Vicinamibacterales bacterium]|jgi:hypothetical protein|nr:hypothetical protein [Vicinamibacterales bacterium]
MGRLSTLAVTVPVIALAVAWLALLGAERIGISALWGLIPRNLAEAAAFRDGAAIVRAVARGENPDAPAEVRAGFLSTEPLALTPLEAAARVSGEEVVRLLLDLGAGRDAAAWTRAWCSTGADAVRAELSAARPADAATECR